MPPRIPASHFGIRFAGMVNSSIDNEDRYSFAAFVSVVELRKVRNKSNKIVIFICWFTICYPFISNNEFDYSTQVYPAKEPIVKGRILGFLGWIISNE